MDYEAMLTKAIDDMPSAVHERERFEIPKVKGHLQGNKTIISNFPQIAESFQRPVQHLFRFLLKELAAPGTINKAHAIFGAKIPASKINERVRKYAEEFVLCKKCGKPDTQLSKDGELVNLTCQACGTKYVVKTRL
ncbi:translation initiation factor IF-2 subunit beta [Candidatus Woesearchaeota archaeon]|nr:translation initiation factor IF-2 subunit beta [Candidatus Woesearchaeota archaeon]MBT4367762.1 translation initiation factor IF-2 subunit beta [Candidatus Woesearchaeota archaeon]MBT4712250.1 translation initiation factor IF-2 subunit beta [Candidatus Woesearchaeota archaeon]MBT6638798.1 translation initiation factor IF-2 subunit beta [Candidatus Woesearchaeota archaeon]MBT7134442.1 translation initiation factor IF-2 subunit beta [Candidatus Woesearchaeota archaeon]